MSGMPCQRKGWLGADKPSGYNPHFERRPMTDFEKIAGAQLPWERFEGATVLVTGASGFLPAYCVETLLYLNREVLRRPCRVVALVRNSKRAKERFGDRDDLEIWEQDVSCSVPDISVNYVLHAASQASPVYYKADPVGTLSPNTIGTAKLLDLCRKQSECRGFLFFSSGDAALPLDPLDIRSCYGESKRMGETMCMAWYRQYGVPVRIARISHTYGPGMRLDDGRVFADFTRNILSGGPIILNSDGMARRCFLYLADATEAFFTILLNGAADAYNVCHTEEVSIRELADRLASEFHLTFEYRAGKPNYSPATIQGRQPNIDKTRALGWNPTTGIEEGFRKTVESYR